MANPTELQKSYKHFLKPSVDINPKKQGISAQGYPKKHNLTTNT
jgi:hypothetical protein